MPVCEPNSSPDTAVYDTGGQRITRRRLRGALRTSTAASLLGMFWVAVAFGVPTTMFMEALGASGVMIGAVVTVNQLAMIVQVPAALFAEKLRTRRAFWGITASIHRFMWLLLPLLPIVCRSRPQRAAALTLVVLAASAVLANCASAPWMSWMADLVPDSMKGRFWGLRQRFTMLSLLASTTFVGWLLDRYPSPSADGGSYRGFSIAFALAAIIGTADIVVHWFVPEPQAAKHPVGRNVFEKLLAPLKSKDYRWLTLSMSAWFFAVGLVGSFGMVYLKRRFQVNYGALTAITIAASIGTAAAGPLWGRMMDRIGPRAFGGLAMAISPLCGVVWFLIGDTRVPFPWFGETVMIHQSVFLLVSSSLVAGAFYSGVMLCQLNLAGLLAPKQGRTIAMAMHWTVVGVIGACGPICGGRIMDFFSNNPISLSLPTGVDVSFVHVLVILHALCVWAIALPLFTRIGKQQVEELSLRTLVGNPLRALSTVQNIMALDAASSRARVKAAKSLGVRKASQATMTLIPQMDDALPEVREAAVGALGMIGTSEAVDALLYKLEDPETDLEHAIIKALRGTRDPRMVDPLLRRLRHGETTVRKESAMALVDAGHIDVAPELMAMLAKERDPKLAFAYSESLVAMRYAPVLPELIRQLKRSRTIAGRRSRALLIADLVGARAGYYRLLSDEEKAPGTAVNGIFKRLLKSKAPDGVMPSDLTVAIRHLEGLYDDEDFATVVSASGRVYVTLRSDDHDGAEEDVPLDPADLAGADWGVLPAREWFLKLCRRGWHDLEGEPCDRIEALLAIHVLSEWGMAR